MTHLTTRVFPCDPTTPGRARAWALAHIRSVLGTNAGTLLLDDVALVVSELMTNATRAGSKSATLSLGLEPGRLRVCVQDDVAARPRLLDASPTDLHGRGLQIVSELAKDWGYTRLGKGKEVWADLNLVPLRAL